MAKNNPFWVGYGGSSEISSSERINNDYHVGGISEPFRIQKEAVFGQFVELSILSFISCTPLPNIFIMYASLGISRNNLLIFDV